MQLPVDREIENSQGLAKRVQWNPAELDSISLVVPQTVYPPREDTKLLDEAIAGLGPGAGRQLLEIGCGSGAISIAAAKRGWDVTSCDVHPLAIAATIGNAADNLCSKSINANEGGPGDGGNWKPENGADVIAWNLPYLDPISEEEQGLGPLEDAGLIYASGGKQLLTELENNPLLLRKGGIVLLLHSSNLIGKILPSMWRKAGWATRVYAESIVGDEKLTVIAAWRPFEGVEPILLEECKSTNLEILDINEVYGQLIMARKQSGGRGQNGKTWEDSPKGFMGSWNLSENSIECAPEFLQISSSVALLDCLSSLKCLPLPSHAWQNSGDILSAGIVVKWPNDIYLNSATEFAKIGGILAESRSKADNLKIAIGIGLNRYGPISDVATAGWNDINGFEIFTREDLLKSLHASMSSLFENHPLVKDIENDQILRAHFASMRPSYYLGNASNKEVIGLTEKGHLLTRCGTIDSSTDLNWSWD